MPIDSVNLNNPVNPAPNSSQPTPPTAYVPAGAQINPEKGNGVDASFLNRKSGESSNNSVKQTNAEFLEALGANNETVKDTGGKAADIYVMPKEFQKHNRVTGASNKGGMMVVVAGLLMLGISLVTVYIYFTNPEMLTSWLGIKNNTPAEISNNPAPMPVATIPVVIENPATSTIAIPAETPQEVYLKYSKNLSNAITFQDYYNTVNVYGSMAKRQQLEASKLLADSDTAMGLNKLQAAKLATPVLTGNEKFLDNLTTSTAALNITLADNVSTGTVEFVLEDNQWKINNETWSLIGSGSGQAFEYKPGADRDNDGLTDAEELLLGTNADNTDSDGDGFSDGQETMNLYNPMGKNKLINNTALKTYTNKDLNLVSVLYPSKWSISSQPTANGQVINFSGADGQAFALSIVANTEKLNLETYFKQQSKETTLDQSQTSSESSWNGISSKNGLDFYLTTIGEPGKYFYHLSYVAGADHILQYSHLFNAIIKSIVIK